jgi:fatty-acyl-CoA synthase
VLCAVAMKGTKLAEKDILVFMKEKLAVYKIPRKILMFTEEDLSFTGNQKIQTDKLIAKALTRLRDESIEIDGVNYNDYLLEADS